MESSTQPVPQDPYQLRPEERIYFLGWIGFVVGGPYLIYRGLVEDRLLFVIVGIAAILLGMSQAAVIGIRRLRPWGKVVRLTWTVLILAGFVAYYATEMLGRPM
jgi:hypothetical protein